MDHHDPITAGTVVDDLMTTHRATIGVFLHHRMMCVGCPVARLHDLAEACAEHAVPLEGFLAEVRAAIGGAGATTGAGGAAENEER